MTRVVVLVEQDSQDTLDWAAAEAAARSAELRVVYAFPWTHPLDAFDELSVDERDLEAADTVVRDAVEYVRGLFPSLHVSSTVFPGRPLTALLNEARETAGALVVIGHGRRYERKLARRLARRTTASLAVVGLTRDRTTGPSVGRVVVAVDGDSDALGFAFGAARRRGTGLTVVGPDDVSAWQTVYPEVDVRHRTDDGTGTVLVESAAAALTVLTLRDDGGVSRLARGPVVLV
ncbi:MULTISPECIES: universal stress protein [Kribbella]|uniref:UspA domain-containing protein n=1 Tax=Kribbella karoonensis TaxID=324851 RepID=A0ABN2CXK6_9ACTN